MIGSKIENYRITSVLGEGGMGVVYKAFDLKLERYVALKILNENAITNPQFVERFKREAKNQAQLSHPNIVPVYGFADDRKLLGFVMEYVNGETLEHRVAQRGRLGLIETLEIMKQVLSGAAHAHIKGFIHRDLKPSNIIFTQDGIAKIMDFGISKSIYETKGITKSGVKIGTLLYMSPEQIRAYEPTRQSDIYALGIIFYEILAGKNPFDADSDFQIMEAHLKKYPPRLSSLLSEIPEEVDRIIFKAIAKSPEKRYQDAQDFYDDIEQELIRLKSEERKTREFLITKEVNKERRIKFGNYALVGSGILFAAIILYLVYSSVSGYFVSAPGKQNDSTVTIYDSSPLRFVNSGWRQIEVPGGESLTDIEFAGSRGLISGFNGTLLYSEDTGETWTKVPSPVNLNFYSVVKISDNVFLLAGEQGILFKFDFDNKLLKKIDLKSEESIFDCYFLDDKTGFIAGGNGSIFKSSDSGESWNKIYTSSKKLLYAITFSSRQKGYAVGWEGEMLVTTDGGESWTPGEKFTTTYLRDISFSENGNGIICGGEGTIFRTVDGGINWKKIEAGISSGLYFVSFINQQNGYILSSRGEILYTADEGENWQVFQSGSYVSLTNISVSPANRLFVTGYNGTILTSE